MNREDANRCIEACIRNAEKLLAAAKNLRLQQQNNIAFHLATLGLEEVGKATIVGITSTTVKPAAFEKDPADWWEDHVKKLFWALWAPAFGTNSNVVGQFRDFHNIALNIYRTRLASTYVDPSNPEGVVQLSDEEVDEMISLVEARANMEKYSSLREIGDDELEPLRWFFQAVENPRYSSIIFAEQSFQYLAQVGRDVRQWVAWLRKEIERLDSYNKELAERELTRKSPTADEARRPKWRVKIRLHSWSHSIRPKTLGIWNKQMSWVKLHPGKGRDQVIVELTLPKKILAAEVWDAGWTMAKLFAAALNIATRGYFWWYVPTHVSKFYEECYDLETKAQVQIELSPPLAVKWGNLALTDRELRETAFVYTYLMRLSGEEREPFVAYVDGLAMLAKNDIHRQIEPSVYELFYRALKKGFEKNALWDGKENFLGVAEVVLKEIFPNLNDVRSHLELGEQLLQGLPPSGLTLREVVIMKIYCDVFFMREIGKAPKSKEKGQDPAGS